MNGYKLPVDAYNRTHEQKTISEEVIRNKLVGKKQKQNVTAEGSFKYFDEVPVLIIEGKNFEKAFYDKEARELFKKMIGANLKDVRDESNSFEDCIRRQWLMECVNEGWIKFDTEKDKNRFIHLVRDIVPSAQTKTGHWIDDKCSVCGKGTEDMIDSREWYRKEDPRFCPFCGVTIESEDRNERSY